MRRIIALGLTILIANSVGAMPKYYTQSMDSWRGTSINSVIKRWGRPDMQMPGTNGHTIYVYHLETSRQYNNRTSPAIGVNNTGGRPVMVVGQNPNAWDQGTLALICIIKFETDAKGIIIHSQSQGNGCY